MTVYEDPRIFDLLAHEVGHWAGYVGDLNGIHSSDPSDLMYGKPEDGSPTLPFHLKVPDMQWCKKVSELAR